MPLILFRWREERVLCIHCTVYIGDHSLLHCDDQLGFSIIPLMGRPDIHSLSPYELIKYLINYLIKNLIALLLNFITNQLSLTIDK